MFIVQHKINDPIVSNPYPEGALGSRTNLGTPVGTWIPRECIDRFHDPPTILMCNVLLQLLCCSFRDSDNIV